MSEVDGLFLTKSIHTIDNLTQKESICHNRKSNPEVKAFSKGGYGTVYVELSVKSNEGLQM